MEISLNERIEKLGLQPNEAKVYLALLELGKGSVTDISKAAKLNRTTGYDIIERLCLQGVANRVLIGKKHLYTAEPPHRLRQLLEDKQKKAENQLKELESVFPDLQALFKSDLKPMIKFAHGKEEMINLYHHVLDTKSEVYSILNLKNYAEEYSEVGEYQSRQRAKKGIKQKVLAINSKTARDWYNKTYKGKKKLRQATKYRWLEWDDRFATAGEVNVFDDKVIVMLSKKTENMAFEIQSQTFADFLKIVFEIAWKNSK